MTNVQNISMRLKKNKMRHVRRLRITKIGGDKMAEYIDKEKARKILNEDYAYAAPSLLDEVPAADVVEVRHGRNITQMHPVDEFICSECGFMCEDCTEKVFNEDGDYFYTREYEYKYCPSCGSKIDEESE